MSFELEILNQLQKLHTPVLDKIMVFITNLGSAGIIWIILTVVCLIIPRTRKVGWVMAASLIVDLILCNGILKNLVARTRPCDVNKSIQLLIKRPWDYSFPSRTYSCFFCFCNSTLSGRRKETVETGTGTGLCHCFFQNVSVCALSDGYSGWCDYWNPVRSSGIQNYKTDTEK